MLEALPPFLGGGEMIETVTMARIDLRPDPAQVRGGHPADRAGRRAGRRLDYLSGVGMEAIAAHEHAITAYALEQLQQVGGLTILGPTEAVDRGGAISFELDGVHPHDVSQVLDSLGVAVRAGHHCAM